MKEHQKWNEIHGCTFFLSRRSYHSRDPAIWPSAEPPVATIRMAFPEAEVKSRPGQKGQETINSFIFLDHEAKTVIPWYFH